jgi:hypothetical protein
LQAPSWRVRLRAFEAFCAHVGPSTPAGAPSDHRTTSAFLRAALDSASAATARPELRRAALDAIQTIHSYRPQDVVAAVHERAGPGTGQTDLMRVRRSSDCTRSCLLVALDRALRGTQAHG